MIVLDTNVISEPLRPAPDTNVLAWLDAQDIDTLYLTTISIAELVYGMAIMPEGKRRQELQAALQDRILSLFASRILPFDEAAAHANAGLRARAKFAGKAISVTDGYIAAIAVAHGFAVATRDTQPFEAAGIDVINPWVSVDL